jgi:hypothetical protein
LEKFWNERRDQHLLLWEDGNILELEVGSSEVYKWNVQVMSKGGVQMTLEVSFHYRSSPDHSCFPPYLVLWVLMLHAINVTFCFVFSGGSVSNMYAMNLARYKYCPDIKEKGMSGLPRFTLFTSAEVKHDSS